MRWFVDSSVLVPTFVDIHPHHEASLRLFNALEGRDAVCGVHNLAEMYATLTRIPPPNRFAPSEALLAVAQTRERVKVLTLDARDYFEVFESAASLGITGPPIHDALIARYAINAGADVIYTWNVRHFNLLGPEVAALVRTP